MADGEKPDDAQKTEEPTPKRLEEARKKGQVPLSREVNNWVMLCMGTILIMMLADSTFGHLKDFMAVFIERAHDIPSGSGGVSTALSNSMVEVLKILFLPLLLLAAAAFLAPFLQIGPLFSAETIKPDMNKISPIKGLERLFSKKSLMEFAKGVLKISIIGAVGFVIIAPYFEAIDHMVGLPLPLLMDELQAMAVKMMIGVLVVLVVVAVIDLAFQRSEHYQNMRMTKQEVKEEMKPMDGDPMVKQRRARVARQLAMQRMSAAVPQADVIVTNPTHYAIALRYDTQTMRAPKVIAKGADLMAMRMRQIAAMHGVPIVERKPLARALFAGVAVGQEVPAEHYAAVAEILAYVYGLAEKKSA